MLLNIARAPSFHGGVLVAYTSKKAKEKWFLTSPQTVDKAPIEFHSIRAFLYTYMYLEFVNNLNKLVDRFKWSLFQRIFASFFMFMHANVIPTFIRIFS